MGQITRGRAIMKKATGKKTKKPTVRMKQSNDKASAEEIAIMSHFLTREGSCRIDDSVLCDFIAAQNNISHIKDAKTGSYIFSNMHTLKFYGLDKNEQLIGRTIFDVDKFMRPYWGNYANKVAKMERLAATTNKIITTKNSISIDVCNKVYVLDTFKLPLSGRRNKVIAMLTMHIDRTKETDLLYLLKLYKNTYDNQKQAVQRFAGFLEITRFFAQGLTYAEMVFLLHMRKYARYQDVAEELDISIRTIETHAYHITKKLKKDCSLSAVLNCIRSR